MAEYDYTASGLDNFLSRSIDNLVRTNLDSAGPNTNQVRYDSAQVSGMLGDTLQLGVVSITKLGITIVDDNNTRVFMGDDGTF